jgi:uncharacterized protein (TIGR02145 family)
MIHQLTFTCIILATLIACDKPEEENEVITVTDIDGNIYQTVTIGNQTWLAENLKVTNYRDGSPISHVTDNAVWGDITTEAYCIPKNNSSNEVDTYGALYNWYALTDSHNIALVGWHVPSDDEWKELEMFLGMSQSEADDEGSRGANEGSKLAGNTDLWCTGYPLGNDTEFGNSGFTALPGGYRHYANGNYYGIGGGAWFWSVNEGNSVSEWSHQVLCAGSGVYRDYSYKSIGYSVRLLKD